MDVIQHQSISRDNELWWADAANTVIQNGLGAHEPITNGVWMTTGDPLRWLKANITLALQDSNLKTEFIKCLQSL